MIQNSVVTLAVYIFIWCPGSEETDHLIFRKCSCPKCTACRGRRGRLVSSVSDFISYQLSQKPGMGPGSPLGWMPPPTWGCVLLNNIIIIIINLCFHYFVANLSLASSWIIDLNLPPVLDMVIWQYEGSILNDFRCSPKNPWNFYFMSESVPLFLPQLLLASFTLWRSSFPILLPNSLVLSLTSASILSGFILILQNRTLGTHNSFLSTRIL